VNELLAQTVAKQRGPVVANTSNKLSKVSRPPTGAPATSGKPLAGVLRGDRARGVWPRAPRCWAPPESWRREM
jgi:hypothetical protein